LLLAAHGAFAWGRDLEQARNRLECLEMLCRLQWMTDGPPACSGREALGA
jgi:ribulose-5-phosphate 4-epimerase/fuculose-1-phosphate aldolase